MTNKLEISREQFESANPVPFGVFWSEPDSRYMTTMVHLNCLEYQGKWLGWQSAMRATPVVERQEPVCIYWDAKTQNCLDVKAEPSLIQTLHANGDRIAMEATIAQQAQRIVDLEGAPVVERQEPALWVVSGGGVRPAPFMTYPAWAEGDYTITGYYAEQPAPVASENLRNFANAMIDIALEGCNADGGHIQELAIKYGLLKPEQRTERCGDTCSCAEYADFPVECFRKARELNQ